VRELQGILNLNRYFLPSNSMNVSDITICILHAAVTAGFKELTTSPRAGICLEILSLRENAGTGHTQDGSEEVCREVKVPSCVVLTVFPAGGYHPG